jgi:hypothetical protein
MSDFGEISELPPAPRRTSTWALWVMAAVVVGGLATLVVLQLAVECGIRQRCEHLQPGTGEPAYDQTKILLEVDDARVLVADANERSASQ